MERPFNINEKNLNDPDFINLLAWIFDTKSRIFSAGAIEAQEGKPKDLFLVKRDRCREVVDALVNYADILKKGDPA